MRSTAKTILILMFFLISTSCDQPNVLKDFASTETDEAFLIEAQKKMDKFKWDEAIDILLHKVSEDGKKLTKTKEKLMHAYGGKCGISFFDMMDSLKNVSSPKMFEFSLQLFAGRNVDVVSCDQAAEVFRTLASDPAQRTKNQNLFGAILGLTRMSTTLHSKLDLENDGEGNGVVDAAAQDFCSNSEDPHFLSDTDLNRIVSGVGMIFENLGTLGGELVSGSAGQAFENAKQFCEMPIELPPIGAPETYSSILNGVSWVDLGFSSNSPTYEELGLFDPAAGAINCLETKDSLVSPLMRRVFRRMIASHSLGYNKCDLDVVSVEMINEPTTYPVPPGTPPPQLKIKAQCCPTLEAP